MGFYVHDPISDVVQRFCTSLYGIHMWSSLDRTIFPVPPANCTSSILLRRTFSDSTLVKVPYGMSG